MSDDLTLYEFLEFEFCFELASCLRLAIRDAQGMKPAIAAFRNTNAQDFMRTSHHVLAHVVSPACRAYIEIKLQRHMSEKRNGAASFQCEQDT